MTRPRGGAGCRSAGASGPAGPRHAVRRSDAYEPATGGARRAGGWSGHDRPGCRCGGQRVPARPGRCSAASWSPPRPPGTACCGEASRASAGLTVAALALAGAVVLLVAGGTPLRSTCSCVVGPAGHACRGACHAGRARGPARRVGAAARPVLFFNPTLRRRQGGALHSSPPRRASAGSSRSSSSPGEDLETLVRGAVDRGADALAMAGGDGSQAIVAAIAAERRAALRVRPRRHAQPLRARPRRRPRRRRRRARRVRRRRRARRGPRRGQRARVRQQRLARALRRGRPARASIATPSCAPCSTPCPTCSAPSGGGSSTCAGPGRAGTSTAPAPMVLVSNNRYRLGRAIGSGTRPRIDDGLLGITVVGEPSGRGEGGRALQRPLREWSAPTFEVDADRPVPAGIDGEALMLDPPLKFRIRPGVLRVRIAPQHPGASPSASIPEGTWAGVLELARIAFRRRTLATHPTHDARRADGHLRGRAEGASQPRGGCGSAAQPRRHARAPQRHRVRAGE